MTITRIYRVQIKPELRAEFEPLFKTVALSSVVNAPGCKCAQLGGPVATSPDEYAVTSEWDSEESLIRFVGSDWTQPHIPDGMERFVKKCWVHHYTSI